MKAKAKKTAPPQGLPPNLLTHAHPLSEVHSYGGELLGWHCALCGLVEGVPQKRRRKCPECKFRRAHTASCSFMARLHRRIAETKARAKADAAKAAALSRKADKLTDRARAEKTRARAEKTRARVEKTRARASALEQKAETYPQQVAA